MKILLLNAQYGYGLNGSLKEYFLYFYRYLYCSKKVLGKYFAKTKRLIAREKPDLVCLVETSSKMLTNLLTSDRLFVNVENKYGEKSWLQKLPIYKKHSNAFLANQQVAFKKRFFRNGIKKMFYEINLSDGTDVFVVHFSLLRRTRKKQFMELSEMLKDRKQYILCGDFNIFKGFEELQTLIGNLDLRLLNSDEHKTFPAVNPKKHLDLFFCSKDVVVKNFKVLKKDVVSDHLPVMLEVV